MKEKWVSVLEDLFIFYACHSRGHSEGAFRKHLEYLSTKCKEPLMEIMLKLLAGEGLAYYSYLIAPSFFSLYANENYLESFFSSFSKNV